MRICGNTQLPLLRCGARRLGSALCSLRFVFAYRGVWLDLGLYFVIYFSLYLSPPSVVSSFSAFFAASASAFALAAAASALALFMESLFIDLIA